MIPGFKYLPMQAGNTSPIEADFGALRASKKENCHIGKEVTKKYARHKFAALANKASSYDRNDCVDLEDCMKPGKLYFAKYGRDAAKQIEY